MARPQSIEEEELVARLSCVFRDVGYEGASLAMLAEAAGLQKASLYHRFPHGKQQMADEVLAAALSWYEAHILSPLTDEGSPAERIATVVRRLNDFYAGGRQACLLNMLAAPRAHGGPFAAAIKGAFEAIIKAFTAFTIDAGHEPKAARSRAERLVMLLHGSLVVSRGLGSPKPFKAFLEALPNELLGAPREGRSGTPNRRNT
jgi:AcrR family transcriptional regulator